MPTSYAGVRDRVSVIPAKGNFRLVVDNQDAIVYCREVGNQAHRENPKGEQKMKVDYSNITPANFSCGQTIENSEGKQFEITDAEEGQATLRELPADERVKDEFLQGRLAE